MNVVASIVTPGFRLRQATLGEWRPVFAVSPAYGGNDISEGAVEAPSDR
jgi:hypothetical protein